MRRRVLATASLLPILSALAACAPRGPDPSCRAQAYRDPGVQDVQMKILGNTPSQAHFQPELNRALQRAELACLRARGEAPPGGVEAPPRSVGRF